MTREEARSKIADVILDPIYNPDEVLQALDNVLDAIYDHGMSVMSTSSGVPQDFVAEFEEAVRAWSYKEDLETEDVNGEAVLHALKERGWVILPPQ